MILKIHITHFGETFLDQKTILLFWSCTHGQQTKILGQKHAISLVPNLLNALLRNDTEETKEGNIPFLTNLQLHLLQNYKLEKTYKFPIIFKCGQSTQDEQNQCVRERCSGNAQRVQRQLVAAGLTHWRETPILRREPPFRVPRVVSRPRAKQETAQSWGEERR